LRKEFSLIVLILLLLLTTFGSGAAVSHDEAVGYGLLVGSASNSVSVPNSVSSFVSSSESELSGPHYSDIELLYLIVVALLVLFFLPLIFLLAFFSIFYVSYLDVIDPRTELLYEEDIKIKVDSKNTNGIKLGIIEPELNINGTKDKIYADFSGIKNFSSGDNWIYILIDYWDVPRTVQSNIFNRKELFIKVDIEFPNSQNIIENYEYTYTCKKDGGDFKIRGPVYMDDTEGKIKISVYSLDRRLPF